MLALKRSLTKMRKSKVVGIFGTWDFSFWSRPEDIFEARLEKNPIYPFEETEEDHYEYDFVSPWFWMSVTVFAIAVLVAILVMIIMRDSTTYVFFTFITILISSYTAYVYKDPRKIVLDQNDETYSFYCKNRLIYKGHVHNIYIRLVGQKSGTGDIYFKIVLNGYNVEEQALTSVTVRKARIEKLARRLATRLNLNFFDWTDRSTCHVIRHRCPYAVSSASHEHFNSAP